MRFGHVLVFGSNLTGCHARDLAYEAFKTWGARQGQAFGKQGDSFALPVTGWEGRLLPLFMIAVYVDIFKDMARQNPDLEFLIPRIACGEGEYSDEEIAPMFKDAPKNCVMDDTWIEILEELGTVKARTRQ